LFDLKIKKSMRLQGFLSDNMERVKGIEPSPQAWEAGVLPLNYTRMLWKARSIIA
jgi:hypothetical protein